jgi:hypothetical protein
MSDTQKQPPSIVDEHVVRLVAGFVVAIAAVALAAGGQWLFALLALDFAARATGRATLSPLAQIARALLQSRKVAPKPAYAPPKRFAARVGLGFAVVAFALWGVGQPLAASVVGALLIGAASLEAFAGFCIACWLYAYLPKPRATAS